MHAIGPFWYSLQFLLFTLPANESTLLRLDSDLQNSELCVNVRERFLGGVESKGPVMEEVMLTVMVMTLSRNSWSRAE